MSGKSVLITGGAGFIGRSLAVHNLRAGHRVTVLDNLCAGRRDNLEPFTDEIELVEGDILDEPLVKDLVKRIKPQTVFHLAAHHFIPFCNEHPSETLRVNVEGTHVVLSEAARQGVEVAVVASSGAFYPSLDTPLDEEVPPAPTDVYGLSKQLAEEVTRFISTSTDTRFVAARLFNTYGPYETNPHLLPHIMESIGASSTVQLGNIHTKRDYVYVTDVAECLFRSAEASRDRYTVTNVGSGEQYSAEELIGFISELVGRTITIDLDTTRLRRVDKQFQRADTHRLRELIGMTPSHSIHDGLKELLEHERLLPL